MAVRKPVPKTERPPFGETWLRDDLGKVVASLALSDEQRHFVSSRWLENVLWMEAAAQRVNALLARETQTSISEIAAPAPTPTASEAAEPSG